MEINYDQLFSLLKTDQKDGETKFLEIQLSLLKQGIVSPVEDHTVIAAMAIASHFHLGQVDKAGKPYFQHCLAVADYFRKERLAFGLIVSAILHDTLEDTTLQRIDIQNVFGDKVAWTVNLLTHYPDLNYKEYIDFLCSEGTHWAIQIKIQDLLQNMNMLRLSRIKEKDIIRTRKYADALISLSARLGEILEKEYDDLF